MYWLWLSLLMLPVFIVLGRLFFFATWADFAGALLTALWGGLHAYWLLDLSDGGASEHRENRRLLSRLLLLLLTTAGLALLLDLSAGQALRQAFLSLGLPL
ncbi:MAG: hypothetical protein RLY93_13455 [Sumerlaeia bacterium]